MAWKKWESGQTHKEVIILHTSCQYGDAGHLWVHQRFIQVSCDAVSTLAFHLNKVPVGEGQE